MVIVTQCNWCEVTVTRYKTTLNKLKRLILMLVDFIHAKTYWIIVVIKNAVIEKIGPVVNRFHYD